MAVCTLPIFEDGAFDYSEQQIEAFKNELKLLIRKYDFGIHGIDDYNGMEENCGTDYYFTVNGLLWGVETIEEILESSFWAELSHGVKTPLNQPSPPSPAR